MFPLEVPVFSPRSASLAIAQHAARVELNRDGSYPEGGLTPTVADLEQLIATYKGTSCAAAAPIRIMIRPRGPPAAAAAGPDFVYSDAEFAEMKAAIRAFRESGLMSLERGDGFVFGCVRELSAGAAVVVVDIGRNRELGALARPFPSVFHRAFDDILGSKGSSVDEALQDLASCGFHGLLTSGGPGSAVNNRDVVAQIIAAAPGKLCEVIVGGGVRSANVQGLKESCMVPEGIDVWFHSSCLTRAGEGDVVDEQEVGALVGALA